MSEQALMKSAIGVDAVKRITSVLTDIIDDFPSQNFTESALLGLDDLELKQRVEHLISVLTCYLPADFEQSALILFQVKQYWDWGDEEDALSGLAAWPLIDYIAVAGIDQPSIALALLKELTPLFSAEFAIRPFIEQHFELSYHTALLWSDDQDEHVRRLASEGFRPRLPWGKKLQMMCDDPRVLFPLLERLKNDRSLYVRKSVANNLNDISKDNPDAVIQCCQQWSREATPSCQWIIRHALRSLIKQGREEVFPLLGYSEQVHIGGVELIVDSDTVYIGDNLTIQTHFTSTATHDQKLVIDYKIHHVRANGKTSAKVFKWKNVELHAQQAITLSKTHSFRLITTRKYYAGRHRIELLINGKSYKTVEFDLLIA